MLAAAQREGISTSPGLYYYKVQVSLQGCLNCSWYDKCSTCGCSLHVLCLAGIMGGCCGMLWCRVVMMPYEGLGL